MYSVIYTCRLNIDAHTHTCMYMIIYTGRLNERDEALLTLQDEQERKDGRARELEVIGMRMHMAMCVIW